MEENALAIMAEMHARLSRLLACERFGSPPKTMMGREPKSILIGMATKEQQALILLFNQIEAEHRQMHQSAGMPYGVNPHVPSDHFRKHVMIPVLHEMFMWSVHRAYPEKNMILETTSFDVDWNMYAVPKPRRRKKKTSAS